MFERFRFIILGAVLIAVGGGVIAVLTYRAAPVDITIVPPPPTDMPTPTATPAPLKVYVTGAVVNPGAVYELPLGSRILDAIQAAGGTQPDADTSQLNMAQVLTDGEQVNVLAIKPTGIATATKPGATATLAKPTAIPTLGPASASDPVHINSGDLTEVERLPRVGPVLGQAIIDYRTKHGPFKTMANLDRVPGVGPATLKAWDGLISFD